MSEMATAPFGQLAISNQPSFHIPYLFRYSNYPDYTALLIKTFRQKAFHPSWEAYPGDEDNGSLPGEAKNENDVTWFVPRSHGGDVRLKHPYPPN